MVIYTTSNYSICSHSTKCMAIITTSNYALNCNTLVWNKRVYEVSKSCYTNISCEYCTSTTNNRNCCIIERILWSWIEMISLESILSTFKDNRTFFKFNTISNSKSMKSIKRNSNNTNNRVIICKPNVVFDYC